MAPLHNKPCHPSFIWISIFFRLHTSLLLHRHLVSSCFIKILLCSRADMNHFHSTRLFSRCLRAAATAAPSDEPPRGLPCHDPSGECQITSFTKHFHSLLKIMILPEPRARFTLLQTIWTKTPVSKQECLSSARIVVTLNPTHSDLFPVYWQPNNICSRISRCVRWKYEYILESPWLTAGRPQDRGSIPDKGRHFYVRNLWLAQHWRWRFWSSWKTDTKASKERCAFIFMGCGVLEDTTTLEDITATVLPNVGMSTPLHSTAPRNTKTFVHFSLLHRILNDWTNSAYYPIAIKGSSEVRQLQREARHSPPTG